MTDTLSRPTRRLTTALVRNAGRLKPVVVTLTGDRIELRLKGERRAYTMTASAAYVMAAHNHVLAERARRKAEREAKRKARKQ